MVQGRQRQPFEILFTFSLNNILSLIADHLSKKHFWQSTEKSAQWRTGRGENSAQTGQLMEKCWKRLSGHKPAKFH
jgi:hypothetical protein